MYDLAIIGLDGVGKDALSMFIDFMPFLKSLLKNGITYEIKTNPPYTPPIWTSIASGVNPGRHSIIGFNKIIFNHRTGEVCKKLNTSGDVKYPRLWEYTNILKIRSVTINYPIMYPLPTKGSENNILITGWDSPIAQIYPPNLNNYEYIGIYHHKWWKTKNKKRYIQQLINDLKKRLQLIVHLVENYRNDYLNLIISELDWIQHACIRKKADISQDIINMLDIIDKFIEKIYKKYKNILILSDHDHHTYNMCINIAYPFVRSNKCDIVFEKDNFFIRLYEAFINKCFKGIIFRNKIIRKLFVGGIAKLFNEKAKIKDIYIFEHNIGFYLTDNLRRDIYELIDYFEKELGLRLVSKDKMFWGENIDLLPDYFIDYLSLKKEFDICHEFELRTVYNITGRDHFPNGIFIYSGNKDFKSDLVVKKITELYPWEVTQVVLYILNNGRTTDLLDGRKLFSDNSLNKQIKKTILAKKLYSLKIFMKDTIN